MGTCLLLFLLGAGLFFIFDRIFEDEQEQKLKQAWSEFARHTGMSFDSGSRTFFQHHDPMTVYGKYRGCNFSLSEVIENRSVGGTDFGDITVPTPYTLIWLLVDNPANLSLTVRPRGLLARAFPKGSVAGGDKAFDRCYGVEGSPREFVSRAVQLIVPRKNILLQRPEGTIMPMIITAPWVSWGSWSRPSIQLKGAHLDCWQCGGVTDEDVLIAFLDLVHDLAELVEQMQSQVVTPASI